MEIRLDGRSAIVTGGSKGLGLATALRFVQAGANVAILARGHEALAAAKSRLSDVAEGRKILALSCDVASATQLESAFQEIESAFGSVDILVNNAGESRRGAFESVTDDMWTADIDQKLMAAVRLTRLAWPGMKARQWGRVLNVLSIASRSPRAGGAPTAVSRAAGLALTKVLAHEGAPHGILANALLVGAIRTDQIVRTSRRPDAALSLDQLIANAGREVPLGRMGEPEEFANVACFLASDAASYVTGSALPVDGGKSPVI